MAPTPFFSAASVLGSRPGSVGVRVSGCPGAAWVWRPAYRPGGSVRAGRSLALAVPRGLSAAAVGAQLLATFPGHSFRVRAHGGRVFLRVRGTRLYAVASLFSARYHGGGQ